jgi:hypothetical protein
LERGKNFVRGMAQKINFGHEGFNNVERSVKTSIYEIIILFHEWRINYRYLIPGCFNNVKGLLKPLRGDFQILFSD